MNNYSNSISRIVLQAISKSFGWMSVGLAVTGIVSWYMVHNATLFAHLMGNFNVVMISAFIFEMVIIGILGNNIASLSTRAASFLFLLFSAINGVTLSSIFLVYSLSSITSVFFISAGMFSLMALYGLTTKHDLRPLGLFFSAVLFGVIILGFINIFFRSIIFDKTMAFIGVVLFAGLTAYDVQKVRSLLAEMAYEKEAQGKMAIYAALTLYLDFINMFLSLLRLLGKKKDK